MVWLHQEERMKSALAPTAIRSVHIRARMFVVAFVLAISVVSTVPVAAQNYRNQIGIKGGFATLPDAFTWGAMHLVPEQFASANIKPQQTFGTPGLSVPAKAYSYYISWAAADGDEAFADAVFMGVEQPLAPHDTIDPQIPTCFAFLSELLESSSNDKGQALTAFNSLTTLQKTNAEIQTDVTTITWSTQHLRYRRQRVACF